MPPGIGYQFAPGAGLDVPMDGAQTQARPQGPQEAVRLLNLHLPKREAPRQIVPSALLTGAGGGGLMGQGLGGLDTVLQHLMQAFSSPAPSAPVIPSRQGPMPTSQPVDIGRGGPSPAAPPEFVGHIDTPPTQNAPPLFGGPSGGVDPATWMTQVGNTSYDPPTNDPFGGWFYESQANPFDNFWLQLIANQVQQAQPQRSAPPPTHFTVENPRPGGGSNA